MDLFKWLSIPTGATKQVKAYESWCVRYKSRHSEYSSGTKPAAEFFTNEQDAKDFAKQLEAAFKLIKNTADNHIIIEKNK